MENEEYEFKIKPVYQFQSVEVVVKGTRKDLPKIMDLYSDILNGLMTIAPEQKEKINTPSVPLATEKQKEIMRKFGIAFTSKTTNEEAQKLITQSIEESKK